MSRRRVLPGFGLSMGITIAFVSAFVVLPFTGLALKAAGITGAQLWKTLSAKRAVASITLSLEASLAAAVLDGVLGLLVAWVLARYRFPGRRLADALIDLPFALPTAVAGIVLTTLYSKNGWLGSPLEHLGLKVAYTPLGIVLALTFIGLPFVVRNIQPVLSDLQVDAEEAAASLGASRWQTFVRVILPAVRPSLFTGVALAFARGIGEYGSVVFISGNLPNRTEIAPILIMSKLEQYDYTGAAALALVMLGLSIVMLGVIQLLHRWTSAGAAA